MIVRYLPLILVLTALALALAPIEAAGQPELGPGIRTEMTPVDREAHNGVFDHVKRKPATAGRKPTVVLGEVRPVQTVTAEEAASRYITRAAPYTTDPPPPRAKGKSHPDRQPRPKTGPETGQKTGQKTGAAPLNSSSQDRPPPQGPDAREARPAQAFPPERVEEAFPDSTPPAPSRAGVDTADPGVARKDDPRSVEERPDPGG